MTLNEDVFATVEVIGDVHATDEQAIVDELVSRGYAPVRAEVLAVFVPLGLARAVIARLPVDSPVRWSDSAIVCVGRRELHLSLADVPEFQTARHIGEETFVNGIIPRERFILAVGFSLELKLINQALDAGAEIGGGELAAPRLLRLAGTPGFEDWYQTISARAN